MWVQFYCATVFSVFVVMLAGYGCKNDEGSAGTGATLFPTATATPDSPQTTQKNITPAGSFSPNAWRWETGIDSTTGLGGGVLFRKGQTLTLLQNDRINRKLHIWEPKNDLTRAWSKKGEIDYTNYGVCENTIFVNNDVVLKCFKDFYSLVFFDSLNSNQKQIINLDKEVELKARSGSAFFVASNYESNRILTKGADNQWTVSATLQGGEVNAVSDDFLFMRHSGKIVVYKSTGSGWIKDAELKSPFPDSLGMGMPGGNGEYANGFFVVGNKSESFGPELPQTQEEANAAANQFKFSGAVYIYKKTESGWAFDARIRAPNADKGDLFGQSVRFDGTTLAVSALKEASNATGIFTDLESEQAGTVMRTNISETTNHSIGAIYLFRHHDGKWRPEAYIKSPGLTDSGETYRGAELGWDLSLLGNTLVSTGFGKINQYNQWVNVLGIFTFAPKCDGKGPPEIDSDSDGWPDGSDCEPCNPDLHPGVDFKSTPTENGSYDWNCDGQIEKQITSIGSCKYSTTSNKCEERSGWENAVPDCGQKRALISHCLTPQPFVCATYWTPIKAQVCR